MTDALRPSDIFVSYRRDDAALYVEALGERLVASFGAHRVFRDTYSIKPGANFAHEIERRLKGCSVLIAVIGRNWLSAVDAETGRRRLDNPDDYLRLELSTALKNENLTVIPVLVGNAAMPKASDLPPDLCELCMRQALEVVEGNRFGSDAERLVRAIENADPKLVRRGKTRSIEYAKSRRPRTGKPSTLPGARIDPPPVSCPPPGVAPEPPEPPAVRPRADRPSIDRLVDRLSGVGWRQLASLDSRIGVTALIVAVFAANWLETSLETVLREQLKLGERLGFDFARAMSWFEGGLSFERHDMSGGLAVYGGSLAYFFVHPLLLLLTMAVLMSRRDVAAYRTFALAIASAYAISLGCYILVPVPERWAFPDSQAVLLSDLWSAELIRAVRPISGLDNCFPSFHVSSSVIIAAVWYVNRLSFRRSIALLSLAVILSTFLLGIHWLPDIIAGTALGAVSVRLAQRFSAARLGSASPVTTVAPDLFAQAGV